MENRHATIEQTEVLAPLVCSRFLGYMIKEATTTEGRREISSEIIRCTNDEKLQSLANLYKNTFLRCCEFPSDIWTSRRPQRLVIAAKGRIPTPSHHPSAPSFDQKHEEFLEKLLETPNSHAKAKKLVSTTI